MLDAFAGVLPCTVALAEAFMCPVPSNDDSQSAGSWNDVDTEQQGPGKSFKKGTIASVGGLMIQLGLKLYMSTGSAPGRGVLSYPIVVTK